MRVLFDVTHPAHVHLDSRRWVAIRLLRPRYKDVRIIGNVTMESTMWLTSTAK